MALRHCPEWSPASLVCPMQTARFACKAAFDHVRLWHKADMLNALTNVRFWWQSGHDADVTRCLLMTYSGHWSFAPAPGNPAIAAYR